eukprot:TRINITY_DN8888_c0_g3_i1.p1 TRINITY_DN8888_c0_g3~~TRINITY_DN8888_c0_g3_i1.p1  ORF type:complete len:435 (+),score=78.23 TRINITY_DN8888_c0_g3_i1:183-1487(+)
MWRRVVRKTAELIPELIGRASYEAFNLFGKILQLLPSSVRMFISTTFVWFLRIQVDTFWTWVQWYIWFPSPWAIGHDEKRLSSGIERLETRSYGAQRLEQLHKLTPSAEHAAQVERNTSKHMLYIHGGGFVFASSAVLIQSVTAFVRSGFTVYSIDYPLAPESRFPGPLLSTIRALHWIKAHDGVDNVVLLGDSAGASLAAMASAIIMNPKLRAEFASASSCPELETWEFPAIKRLGCLYGLLDSKSWRGRQLKQISRVENWLAEGGIAGCLELYRSLDNAFNNKICLVDIADDIEHFPPTLFIGGSRDPLVYSTVVAHECLLAKGLDVHCKIYPARHGFFGVPVEWTFGQWRHDAQPAFQLLRHFYKRDVIGRHHKRKCSLTLDGTRCCLEEQGDYGLHALKAYDRRIGRGAEGDDEQGVTAAELLSSTMLAS